jgi:hypothetical protein
VSALCQRRVIDGLYVVVVRIYRFLCLAGRHVILALLSMLLCKMCRVVRWLGKPYPSRKNLVGRYSECRATHRFPYEEHPMSRSRYSLVCCATFPNEGKQQTRTAV